MAGSIPSLFGALASWAKNSRQTRDFSMDIQDGIRQRTQRQVEERLKPLCDQFHRAVMKLRPIDDPSRKSDSSISSAMRLSGIDELQNRSHQIFDSAIASNATSSFLVQLFALLWDTHILDFHGWPNRSHLPRVLYGIFHALGGSETNIEHFPHPSPSLMLTSVVLSTLPLAIYCMIILTSTLSRRKVARVAQSIVQDHERAIAELKRSNVIRLEFEDDLLQQAQFLLNLRRTTEFL